MTGLSRRSAASERASHRPHFVYQLWSADRGCLYVGMSLNPGARLQQHQRQTYWKYVTDIKMERWSDRDTARTREAELIGHHQPRHNIYLTDDPTERRLTRS